jgi:5'(3')-deoxyribonucleotidase
VTRTILLDIDNTLADLSTPVHRTAERFFGRALPQPKDWWSFEFHESLELNNIERYDLYDHIHDEDVLGWMVQPYPGAQDFVKELLERDYDVVAVTAHWTLGGILPCWVPARCELITECFFDIPVILTHHKNRVQGDFLVDDGVHNMTERGILFDQPWNRNYTHPRRAKSYAEILEMIK